jgi:hypothetical protein
MLFGSTAVALEKLLSTAPLVIRPHMSTTQYIFLCFSVCFFLFANEAMDGTWWLSISRSSPQKCEHGGSTAQA